PPPPTRRQPVRADSALLVCGDPGVLCAKRRQVPPARYPAELAGTEAYGTAVVSVLVGEAGSVLDTEISESSGSERLDEAALEAARGATFWPATRSGVPGPSRESLVFDFGLGS
ncbi:MAG: energy transducer TonB, partial [Thermoanaerobaculia bacterium]|nr:energy transducer TonB [Thermoanaerobaculia bacterium]